MLRPALVALCLLVTAVWSFLFCDPLCGTPEVQPRSPRIVGGHEALVGSLPWTVVLLEYNLFLCGGAIVNEYFVLTAAHCFYGRNMADLSRWRVVAGKHSLNRVDVGEQVLTVAAILLHHSYNHTSGANDIALLKMSNPISYTDKIRAVCLPSDTEILTTGQPCVAAGWGETLDTGERFDSLLQVTLPIISDEVCARPDWQRQFFLAGLTLCAGYQEGGKDTCLGDSGSPLVCEFLGKWYVSGIVSLGRTCALPRKPGIYTNVSHYSLWVRFTMAENGYTQSCS